MAAAVEEALGRPDRRRRGGGEGRLHRPHAPGAPPRSGASRARRARSGARRGRFATSPTSAGADDARPRPRLGWRLRAHPGARASHHARRQAGHDAASARGGRDHQPAQRDTEALLARSRAASSLGPPRPRGSRPFSSPTSSGDPLDVIASGPTTPDASTVRGGPRTSSIDSILRERRPAVHRPEAPSGVTRGAARRRPSRATRSSRAVSNTVIGNNALVVEAAAARARELGLHASRARRDPSRARRARWAGPLRRRWRAPSRPAAGRSRRPPA